MSIEAVSVPKVLPQIESGDELSGEAFCRAFNDIRAKLVSTLFLMLNSQEDAQDVAQDVFLKCWRTKHTLADIRNFQAWIFRLGINAAKDLQRNAWRRRARPLGSEADCAEVGQAATSPEEVAQEREMMERLRQALLELRPEEKAVFLLRQNGDLTYEEIAEVRRSPVGTVKTQMRTALQKLKKLLKES